MSADPARLGAVAARDAIRAGTLHPAALLEACLARIAARDAVVRAWDTLDPAQARGTVGAGNGGAGGLLAGLPVGVKDVIETADMPTACASAIHAGRRTGRDAACVAALRAAGGVVPGKTATTEFAGYHPTVTRNPHDPARTPGGSSSGSAAAVADFQVPLAIGTQTAGSVLRPAAFCGVVGFKPGFGVIDTSGLFAFSASLDTLGVFARSVADAGLAVAALSGWSALAGVRPAPPARVRLIPAPSWHLASAAGRAALTDAAGRIADAGVAVDDAPLPGDLADALAALADAQALIQPFEGRRALAWERAHHADRLSPALRAAFDAMDAVGFEDYRAARRLQAEWQARIATLMTPDEVWLTLPAPGEAPEGTATGDPVFNRAWTLLHLPAISLPHGRGPAGMPLGLQLVGRDDARLLAAAAWLEPLLTPAGPPPA